MNKGNCIIEGSERWVERVPDEYAIKHVEAYISPIEKHKMILKFKYVKNICGAYGTGFAERIGTVKVVHNIGEFIEGIIICQNDISEQPGVYYKTKQRFYYVGNLSKCEFDNVICKPLNFSNVLYYSGRKFERQKSEESSPEWLKEFAAKRGANVAYFEF